MRDFYRWNAPWHIANGKVTEAKAGVAGESISILTAHIIGSKNMFHRESLELLGVCDVRNREVLELEGSHNIPQDSKITSDMVALIRRTIERSLLMH